MIGELRLPVKLYVTTEINFINCKLSEIQYCCNEARCVTCKWCVSQCVNNAQKYLFWQRPSTWPHCLPKIHKAARTVVAASFKAELAPEKKHKKMLLPLTCTRLFLSMITALIVILGREKTSMLQSHPLIHNLCIKLEPSNLHFFSISSNFSIFNIPFPIYMFASDPDSG